ncbi:hypothetical protein Q8A73_009366 [Channa argus]|nr:hypothetical protein Q8A73_009366 [Channa argus]
MNWTCFTHTPGPEKPTVVYDENSDSENLWTWNGSLPLCASSAAPDSRCLVCSSDGFLHTVCRNLKAGVKLVMEGEGVTLDAVKSECPQLLSDGERPWWLLLLIIIIIIPLIAAALVVYCKGRESKKAPESGGRDSAEAVVGAAE